MEKGTKAKILLATVLTGAVAGLAEWKPWESASQQNAHSDLQAYAGVEAAKIRETVKDIQNPALLSTHDQNDGRVDRIAGEAHQLSIVGPGYVDDASWKKTEQALEAAKNNGTRSLDDIQLSVIGNSIRELKGAGFKFD